MLVGTLLNMSGLGCSEQKAIISTIPILYLCYDGYVLPKLTYEVWLINSALDHRCKIHLALLSPCVGILLFVVIGKSVLHSRNGLPQKSPIGPVTPRFG